MRPGRDNPQGFASHLGKKKLSDGRGMLLLLPESITIPVISDNGIRTALPLGTAVKDNGENYKVWAQT